MRQFLLPLCLVSAVTAGPIVNIPGLGQVEGITRNVNGSMVDSFLGVQYAKAERWEVPEKMDAWNGVKPAVKHGATCPGSLCIRDEFEESETCQFLNVHKPAGSPQGLAVMLWIHGGSYDFGCGDAYEGQQLVMRSANKAVVITINYRLNVFGFLGSPKMTGKDGSTGNWGFLDQRAAIQWAHDNVAAFGGDPSRITIFGESAGAGSVACHLTSITTPKGFFSKAIAQSGLGAVWDSNPMERTVDNFNSIMEKTNCTTVACMKAVPWRQLENTLQSATPNRIMGSGNMHLTWGPTVDKVHFTQYPYEAFAAGEYLQPVDIIAGTNRDEMSLFLAPEPFGDEVLFDAMISVYLKSPIYLPEVKALYSNASYEYPANLGDYNWWWWAMMRASTDAMFTCPSRRSARGLVKKNPNVYVYTLMHHKSYAPFVPHTADLPYVFDCMGVPTQDHCPFTYPEYPFEQGFADDVSGFWTNFAVTGSPGGLWSTRYNPTTDSHFLLDVEPKYNGTGFKYVPTFRDPQCDFWDKMLSDE